MKQVFCLGVWDVLHIGHISLLNKASNLGELTVGVVKDYAVVKEKGLGRPIFSESDRLNNIFNLKCVKGCLHVDKFIIPEFVIEGYDIIIIGADQNHIKNLDKIPYEKKIIFPRYEGISTSQIIERIKNL